MPRAFHQILMGCCGGSKHDTVSWDRRTHNPYTPRAVPNGMLKRWRTDRIIATIRDQDAIRRRPIPVTTAGSEVINRTKKMMPPTIETIGIAIVASCSCRDNIPMMPTAPPKMNMITKAAMRPKDPQIMFNMPNS